MPRAFKRRMQKASCPRERRLASPICGRADQNLGGGVGHWHPHMMVFSPNYETSMLGNNPFGAPLPLVTDDAGTAFAVVVIPVDDKLAIKAK